MWRNSSPQALSCRMNRASVLSRNTAVAEESRIQRRETTASVLPFKKNQCSKLITASSNASQHLLPFQKSNQPSTRESPSEKFQVSFARSPRAKRGAASRAPNPVRVIHQRGPCGIPKGACEKSELARPEKTNVTLRSKGSITVVNRKRL